ncbi:MAG: porphobilinogen synthase [Candidatus Omnitrophota bacterium]
MDIRLDKLIYPVFVKNGKESVEEISSMPGVFRFSPDALVEEVDGLSRAGLKNILIFGIPDTRDPKGTSAYAEDNIVSGTIKKIKKDFPGITVFTDVCLCAYTSHGHCGVIQKSESRIDNSATLQALSEMAVSHARAGADYVSPSAMAANQVKAIRETLDKRGLTNTRIMGYSSKFASNAYGPFREIADSSPRFGDRKGYQLDYTAKETALSKIEQDIADGADIVMVKPVLWYLDIVSEAKRRFNYPLAGYNVSGEYAMIKSGARLGWWSEKEMVFEIISSIKRAGADLIITYHAKDIAKWVK